MDTEPLLPHWISIRNGLWTVTKHRRAAKKCATSKTGAKGNCSMHINSFMSGNQSFNQSLYAPLTRAPLGCRPAVNFTRKVYMKRRPILRGILSAGVIVQLALLLWTVPLHAQSGLVRRNAKDAVVSWIHESRRSAFDDSTPKPEQHVLTADHAPGDVYGVTRYPSGLANGGRTDCHSQRGCGRRAVHSQRRRWKLRFQEVSNRAIIK